MICGHTKIALNDIWGLGVDSARMGMLLPPCIIFLLVAMFIPDFDRRYFSPFLPIACCSIIADIIDGLCPVIRAIQWRRRQRKESTKQNKTDSNVSVAVASENGTIANNMTAPIAVGSDDEIILLTPVTAAAAAATNTSVTTLPVYSRRFSNMIDGTQTMVGHHGAMTDTGSPPTTNVVNRLTLPPPSPHPSASVSPMPTSRAVQAAGPSTVGRSSTTLFATTAARSHQTTPEAWRSDEFMSLLEHPVGCSLFMKHLQR
jgi:hypothetical protein